MIECLTPGLLFRPWNIYHDTTAYFFEPPCIYTHSVLNEQSRTDVQQKETRTTATMRRHLYVYSALYVTGAISRLDLGKHALFSRSATLHYKNQRSNHAAMRVHFHPIDVRIAGLWLFSIMPDWHWRDPIWFKWNVQIGRLATIHRPGSHTGDIKITPLLELPRPCDWEKRTFWLEVHRSNASTLHEWAL